MCNIKLLNIIQPLQIFVYYTFNTCVYIYVAAQHASSLEVTCNFKPNLEIGRTSEIGPKGGQVLNLVESTEYS